MEYRTEMIETLPHSSWVLRGAIIKKNEKIWEKFPNGGGGGVKIKKIKSQFQFGNFEDPGGQGLNFSKMSQS